MAAPLIGAGGALQAIGAIQGANTSIAGLRSEATAADYNAEALEQQADVALSQGASEESRIRREGRQVQGKARAAAAQSGTGMGGSTGRVLRQNALQQELDALNIRYRTGLVSSDLRSRARQSRYQAGVARSMVSPTRRAGFIGAGASLLSAGGMAQLG